MKSIKLSRKAVRWEVVMQHNDEPYGYFNTHETADMVRFLESYFDSSAPAIDVEPAARPIVRVTCAKRDFVCTCRASQGQCVSGMTLSCFACGRRWIHSASVTANGVTSWDWDLVTEGRA